MVMTVIFQRGRGGQNFCGKKLQGNGAAPSCRKTAFSNGVLNP